MDSRMTAIAEAADYMKSRLGGRMPQVGIILGSGLGKLADSIENPVVIPYTDVPNFVKSTAIGHKGNFISGTLGPCRDAFIITRDIPWTR